MPVRAIKQIRILPTYAVDRMYFPIPSSILYCDAYSDEYKGEWSRKFLCKVINHFDENKNLVRKIDESAGFQPGRNTLLLGSHLLTAKYGFVEGEYLEIIFQSFEREYKRKKWFRTEIEIETIPIFPERMIEDLDFMPK